MEGVDEKLNDVFFIETSTEISEERKAKNSITV
jgi:hypothetical protein